MYQSVYYQSRRGELPVQAFIMDLSVKTRHKAYAILKLLENEGPSLRRPYADKLRPNLYELRVRLGSDQIRILYSFFSINRIVLLHAFRKKTREIPEKEIQIASHRFDEFANRCNDEGGMLKTWQKK